MEKTYQEKITLLLIEIATLKKKSDQISIFRLLMIIGLLVVVYQLFKLNEIVGGFSIIGGILGFYYLVKFHEKIDSEIDLKEIIEVIPCTEKAKKSILEVKEWQM